MRLAAIDAQTFVGGMSRDEFFRDRRTQQAVLMTLTVVGEVATLILNRYPSFAAAHPEIDWSAIKAFRNRLVHGYFDINLSIVWDTVQTAIPKLLHDLSNLPEEP